jgi:hypothetical protein
MRLSIAPAVSMTVEEAHKILDILYSMLAGPVNE